MTMSVLVHDTAGPWASTGHGGSGPAAWQRTDTVGTELVFLHDGAVPAADGSAVVAGPIPYAGQWHADLDADRSVRSLTVTCRGGDWSRTLWLTREDGAWTCHAEESGELAPLVTAAGRPAPPPPGVDDPARLHADAVLRLADSPIFVTWALHRLRLTPDDGPVRVPTVRVLCPSLAVVPGTWTYQLVGERRLRVTGDGPAVTYHLDPGGHVTYRPGRLRLVH
jgi:hypothetical protein